MLTLVHRHILQREDDIKRMHLLGILRWVLFAATQGPAIAEAQRMVCGRFRGAGGRRARHGSIRCDFSPERRHSKPTSWVQRNARYHNPGLRVEAPQGPEQRLIAWSRKNRKGEGADVLYSNRNAGAGLGVGFLLEHF